MTAALTVCIDYPAALQSAVDSLPTRLTLEKRECGTAARPGDFRATWWTLNLEAIQRVWVN